MSTRLLIARHGNTFGPHDLVTRVGTTDLPLVESGLMQGRMLGAYLNENNLIPDVIFTSKLKRTIQTAEEMQHMMNMNLSIEPLSIFNEIDYGPDENQPEEIVKARLGSDAIKAWEMQAIVPDGWKVCPADIIHNWKKFALQLLQTYAGKTCLVITSNGIARFAPYLTGDFVAFSKQYPIKIATGALCIFEYSPHKEVWDCIQWNIKPEKSGASISGDT